MYIKYKMDSLGFEICDDCKKPIKRGNTINVVIYEDETPYGRIDDKCLSLLKDQAKNLKNNNKGKNNAIHNNS